jgi:hypothetical protein
MTSFVAVKVFMGELRLAGVLRECGAAEIQPAFSAPQTRLVVSLHSALQRKSQWESLTARLDRYK